MDFILYFLLFFLCFYVCRIASTVLNPWWRLCISWNTLGWFGGYAIYFKNVHTNALLFTAYSSRNILHSGARIVLTSSISTLFNKDFLFLYIYSNYVICIAAAKSHGDIFPNTLVDTCIRKTIRQETLSFCLFRAQNSNRVLTCPSPNHIYSHFPCSLPTSLLLNLNPLLALC